MGRAHHPRRGSMAYSPRKRALSEKVSLSTWPDIDGAPKIQGFAGYKAGMTHAIMVDKRDRTTTAGMEIQVPVTVLEVPPMKVVAIRVYKETCYGLKTAKEVWTNKLDKELAGRFPTPKNYSEEDMEKKLDTLLSDDADEVRIIAHTQPKLVTGVPKKIPELMELRIGGGTIKERLEYAKSILGKEITIKDFTEEGSLIDVSAVTKGKGFQGHIKRWGVKRQPHKNSKHIRMIGTLGPHFPSYVLPTVPQAGQMGYHRRTEFNKRILKIGERGEEITPSGGFLRYGTVRNGYILIYGSVPGPPKRLIRLRDPIRPPKGYKMEKPELVYISRESKQGA